MGYAIPSEFGAFIRDIVENVPNLGDTIISVHCHNDLGLATANSLMAVRNGARQVEVAVNGLGERAGNASLEEIAMSLSVRGDYLGIGTNINTKEIIPHEPPRVSPDRYHCPGRTRPSSALTRSPHESGIHVDGLLKMRATYEIMTPDSIGLTDMKIVLGRHSRQARISETPGRHGISFIRG